MNFKKSISTKQKTGFFNSSSNPISELKRFGINNNDDLKKVLESKHESCSKTKENTYSVRLEATIGGADFIVMSKSEAPFGTSIRDLLNRIADSGGGKLSTSGGKGDYITLEDSIVKDGQGDYISIGEALENLRGVFDDDPTYLMIEPASTDDTCFTVEAHQRIKPQESLEMTKQEAIQKVLKAGDGAFIFRTSKPDRNLKITFQSLGRVCHISFDPTKYISDRESDLIEVSLQIQEIIDAITEGNTSKLEKVLQSHLSKWYLLHEEINLSKCINKTFQIKANKALKDNYLSVIDSMKSKSSDLDSNYLQCMAGAAVTAKKCEINKNTSREQSKKIFMEKNAKLGDFLFRVTYSESDTWLSVLSPDEYMENQTAQDKGNPLPHTPRKINVGKFCLKCDVLMEDGYIQNYALSSKKYDDVYRFQDCDASKSLKRLAESFNRNDEKLSEKLQEHLRSYENFYNFPIKRCLNEKRLVITFDIHKSDTEV